MSKRDQLIATILPGAVILTLYILFILFPKQREVSKARERLAGVNTSNSNKDVMAIKAKVDSGMKQRNALRQTLEQRQTSLTDLRGATTGADYQFDVLDNVTRLLRNYSISLISQTIAESPVLSARQENALSQTRDTDGKELVLREFELEGRYIDVMDFMDALQATEAGSPAFPVSFALEAQENSGGLHRWKLVIVVL